MNELLAHYNNLIVILQKMNKSQLQDLGLVNEQLGLITQDMENLKAQLNVCKALAEKSAEEVAAFKTMKKRLRIVSYVELGVGVPCLVLGLLPIWAPEQQNIRNLLLGIGGTSTAAGAVTFTFTITF